MSYADNAPIRIVAGVDGTLESRHAVAWALDEAKRRGEAVELVHAYEYPPPLLPFYAAATELGQDHLREVARAAMKREVADAATREPGVLVSGEVREGPPIEVLLDAAREARLLVLATRGTGAPGELVVGSTGTALAGQAACPVVVVPSPEDGAAAGGSGPVVVGVDGSPHGRAALRQGLAEASLRGRSLVVVHAWHGVPGGVSQSAAAQRRRFRADEVSHQLLVSETLAGEGQLWPEVAVTAHVREDHPVRALLETARSAALLVVGARGTGGYPGLALGSVALAVLHHATRPVCVVPD
ncbi:universal stress protein [Streptacidiphilus jiangxiensis]|uniref:Nucleotide-binding universal stress protein, UspA family n=1 Tax=Streptacidiphilus jiangxiensis TaxID=235985 RepID=A0A1H7QU83_STRJI|nr:universal stress protein [Streptacidiphilus jiangxiensis]SEL51570.1 Nucleotide-binding universal stress protein, UspA family [Streptacidiphilus jiangxiensis]